MPMPMWWFRFAEWERGYTERFGVTYNDFEFGVDPQSPKGWAGQPTAKGQTRTRKDSSRWLQEVWTQNALVDPRPFFANHAGNPKQTNEAKTPTPDPGWARRDSSEP